MIGDEFLPVLGFGIAGYRSFGEREQGFGHGRAAEGWV